MGFLSNVNNEIILDAVLTKYGREKLAAGSDLGISKFALSDDEVDYILYSSVNPYGTDYYDVAIRRLPILEPIPNANTSIRYRLFTSVDTTDSTYRVVYSTPQQFDIGINDVSEYVISPSLSPSPGDVSSIWYKFEINPSNPGASLLSGIDQTVGYPNDLALAYQELQTKINSGAKPAPNYAVGQFAKLKIGKMPRARTSYQISITGYGPQISTRPINISFYLDDNASTHDQE